MTSLPPPSGRPATMSPRPDPWGEQMRRNEEHRSARRRRRRRWLIPPFVLLIGGGLGVGVFVLLDRTGDDAEPPATVSAASSTVAPTTTTSVPTVEPDRLVEVAEVWLLDRGDDVYDWGVNVVAPEADVVRSDVNVTVRLVDAAGAVVESIVRTLDGVNSLIPSTAAGRVTNPDSAPVRIEFDVTVGRATDDLALDALLSTRAVRRSGDELTGRIRSTATAEMTDISMVMVWRDDAAAVAAVVVYDIERLRPGVDAQFRIDLAEQLAPDGLPDVIFWSPAR